LIWQSTRKNRERQLARGQKKAASLNPQWGWRSSESFDSGTRATPIAQIMLEIAPAVARFSP